MCPVRSNEGWPRTASSISAATAAIPNNTVPSDRRPPWTEGRVTQIAVHGCIRYLDVLTDQKRSTEFCFLVRQQALLHREHIELCSGLEFGVSVFSKEFETWVPITFK